jgi:hypothetical protein
MHLNPPQANSIDNYGGKHMSVTIENIGTQPPLRSETGRLRLRLKPAHGSCGFVQGAWWPRSTRLRTELPSLLAALTLRLGPIDRVRYHQGDWSSAAPERIRHLATDVDLNADEDAPYVITLFGNDFGRLALLVVPPYTDPNDAYTAVTTAASVDDASTPEQLLGIGPRRANDRLAARIALSRWATDGGAPPRPALSPRPAPGNTTSTRVGTGGRRSSQP